MNSETFSILGSKCDHVSMLTLALAQVVVLFSIDMNYAEIIMVAICVCFLTKTHLDEKYLANSEFN